MNIFKKSALGLAASLLIIVLFLFGLVLGLYNIFGAADSVKHALRDSGVYQSIVGDVLAQTQRGDQPAGQDKIPLDQPEVKNIIQNAVSPELLQTQSEKALDSLYDWIQGKTPKLEFAIELGDVKQNLANGLEQHITQRAASLPACAPGAPNADTDPFNATCLPQGVNSAQLAAEAKAQILKGEFLKDTTLNTKDLKTENGKSIEEQLQAVPAAYKKVLWAVYGLGLLALLLATAVVFLSEQWRSGLKKVSISFIFVGAVSAVLSLLSSFGISRVSGLATEPLQKSGVRVAELLANDLRTWWIGYGVVLVILGITALIVLHITKPKMATEHSTPNEPVDAELSTESAPSMVTTGEVRRPKPKPTKKLIQ